MTLKDRIAKSLQIKKKSNAKTDISVDSDLTAPVSTTQHSRISTLPKDPALAPDTASNDCNINPVSPLPATKVTAVNASAIAHSVTAASKIAFDVLFNSADVFPPLKSVAGGLSTLLKHYDQSIGNKEKIRRIIPRVEALMKSLDESLKNIDIKEIERRTELMRKLENILESLVPILDQGKVAGFVYNAEQSQVVLDAVEDLSDAIIDYQTSLQQDICSKLADSVDLAVLDKIPHALDAGFNAGDRQKCLRDTRVSVLQRIKDWASDSGEQRMYWLSGMAGIGKTTIAQSFAEYAFAEGRLGASFFCTYESVDRSNLKLIFPTIAYQLSRRIPKFLEHILPVITADPDIGHGSLSYQLQNLIVEPLKRSGVSTIIVVDALDECRDKETVSTFLSLLSRHVHHLSAVKFFISSRPEPHLRSGFKLPLLRPITEVFMLHDVDESIVEGDIKTFLWHHLSRIPDGRSDLDISNPWPSADDIDLLARKCGGFFIYASTSVKFISSPDYDPRERLDLITRPSGISIHKGIDELYTQILKQAYLEVSADDTEIFSRFRLVVGCILLLFNPMSRLDLARLLQLQTTRIKRILRSLHSVLMIPESDDQPIRIFHTSFLDYLTNSTRCNDERFYVSADNLHKNIFILCMDLMNTDLRKNICSIPRYSMNTEVEDLPHRLREHTTDTLEYACRFWAPHLSAVKADGEVVALVVRSLKIFAEHKMLQWMEYLSLIGEIAIAIHSMRDTYKWLEGKAADPNLVALYRDGHRFVFEFSPIIHESAIHLYHSALPLCPASSALRRTYSHELSTQAHIISGLDSAWNQCTRTIERGSHQILSIKFSPDGNLIGFGLRNGISEIVHASTGLSYSTFRQSERLPGGERNGYRQDTRSIAFSSDGTMFSSGSHLGEVAIWDLQSGDLKLSLSSTRRGYMYDMAFSPSGSEIACGFDNMVIVWDLSTRRSSVSVQNHTSFVKAIQWSPSGAFFLTGSDDCTVKVWDSVTKLCLQTLTFHDQQSKILDIAISADSTMIASATTNGTIFVFDTETWKVKAKLSVEYAVRAVSISPKDYQIAYGYDKFVESWDFISGERSRFEGHSDLVNCVAFSPDGGSLVSGSNDSTVKLWQTGSTIQPSDFHPSHSSSIVHVQFSSDGTLVSSLSVDGTLMLWDSSTGVCIDSITRYAYCVAAISPDNSLVLYGTRAFFVCIRKIGKEEPNWILHDNTTETGGLISAQFSPDSKRAVGSFADSTIRVWDIETTDCLAFVDTLFEFGLCSRVLFDQSGDIIISEFKQDNTLVRWHLVSEKPGINPNSTSPRMSLERLPEDLPNSHYLPPRFGLYRVHGEWILDRKGRKVFWLPKTYRLQLWDWESCSAWFGQKIIVGATSGRVAILDFSRIPI